MKKLLPFFALLLTAPAHAFLVNYDFAGTIDWGDTRGQTSMTGSFQADGPTLNKLSLNLGQYRYAYIPQFYEIGGIDPVVMSDCPVVNDNFLEGGDLQIDQSRNLWSFQWRGAEDHLFETGGNLTSFSKSDLVTDAMPTPESTSGVLFGLGLLALAAYRQRKVISQRLY